MVDLRHLVDLRAQAAGVPLSGGQPGLEIALEAGAILVRAIDLPQQPLYSLKVRVWPGLS